MKNPRKRERERDSDRDIRSMTLSSRACYIIIAAQIIIFLIAATTVIVEGLSMSSSSTKTNKQVVLITGANKGIGKEIARKFAQDDRFIPILACRKDGEKTCKELGIDSRYHCYLELTDDDSIEKIVEYIQSTFDGRLDILINNAAICFNDPTLYGKVEYTPFEKQASITIDTNYFGTTKLTNKLLPLLLKSSSEDNDDEHQPGRIITIASSAGRLGILKSQEKLDMFTNNPDLNLETLDTYMKDFITAVENGTSQDNGWPSTCYGMSKLGLIAYSILLSKKYKELLLINTVDPGYCSTDQNDNQGIRPAERGSITPYLLGTTKERFTGLHWYDEQVMPWTYNQF